MGFRLPASNSNSRHNAEGVPKLAITRYYANCGGNPTEYGYIVQSMDESDVEFGNDWMG